MEDWFRLKKYPHIGLPLTLSDFDWVNNYVKNQEKVATHAFLPFIHRSIIKRKFRREKTHDGIRSKLRVPSKKIREIHYAGHLDSLIFSYYSSVLSDKYNSWLRDNSLSENIIGYRRIPLVQESGRVRNKCSIDFAKDVFDFIKKMGTDCVAMTFDITNFFDNLDHGQLKNSWKCILSLKTLPDDHYNVFRNLTKFSYVDIGSLHLQFMDRMLVERNGKIAPKKVIKQKYFRDQKVVAFCRISDLREVRAAGIIKSNKWIDVIGGRRLRNRGIPQGSPISSVLSNIYMMQFDSKVKKLVESSGGLYKRYSDDIVVVCHPSAKPEILKKIHEFVAEAKLTIQKSKTRIFNFKFDSERGMYECSEFNLNTQRSNLNSARFIYLGFEFDGNKVYLKSSSIAGYYRKMKSSIRKSEHFAKKGVKNDGIFKSRLYKRFTYLGSTRRKKYARDPNNKSKFKVTEVTDWGNYLSYGFMAARIFASGEIKGQLSRHWRIFHAFLKEAEARIVLYRTPPSEVPPPSIPPSI